MTLRELINRRDEISFSMLEADNREYQELVEELEWVEEMIDDLEGKGSDSYEEGYYGEENEN